jgi:hypothetical protein
MEIKVAPGTRVTMSGLSLLGGREARVTPGDGPEPHLTAVAILGGVQMKEGTGA